MQTRYCCEFIKILNFLKRKDKKNTYFMVN